MIYDNDNHYHKKLIMLEVWDLTVCYKQHWVVNNVSFSLKTGQLTCLLGPNGAGKSTMIKAILGLIPAIRGVVKFENQPLKKQLSKVAYVPQRSQIDWDYPITVERVVMMGRTKKTGWFRNPSRQSRQLASAALERVDMLKYRNYRIGELSGGQQQRVFLARALAQQAELLFLDEPFTGVDKKTEGIIFDVFTELKSQHKTLLVISHDLGKTLDNYDQFLLLNQKLIASGSKQQVLTTENITQAYGQGLSFFAA